MENSDLVGEPVVDEEATDSRPRDNFNISAPNWCSAVIVVGVGSGMLCGLDARGITNGLSWILVTAVAWNCWLLAAAGNGLEELTWCRAAKVHDYLVCSDPCLLSLPSGRAAPRRHGFGQASTGAAKYSDVLEIIQRKSNHMLAKKSVQLPDYKTNKAA